ncbi:hypothetical protein [Salipaludibacillus aurantiacus]|uniref:Uncharacterized protein n=1 Tax=Salipaludibacillus aurantiacus TaxID=1601833 RepID=A0A1H9S839_9BACI|nr:hypothetical protein [Salipaludibacillus aurantiacus]SER81160.1 hypothetical protein SAMN05518684_10479 [Salipaludibacillus aurantiacus]
MIGQGFHTLHSNLKVALYPILIDLTSIIAAVLLGGYHAVSQLSLQLSVAPGLPSLDNAFSEQISLFTFQIDGQLPAFFTPGLMLIVFLLLFVIGIAVEAGFIGLLHRGVTNKETSFKSFLQFGKKFWFRYLGLILLILLASLPVWALSIGLGLPGIILSFIALVLLRVMFIYWEFTLIVDDLTVIDALSKSYKYFKRGISDTLAVLFIMGLTNTIFGLILSQVPVLPALIVGIILYGYIMTALLFSLMHTLHRIKRHNPEFSQ